MLFMRSSSCLLMASVLCMVFFSTMGHGPDGQKVMCSGEELKMVEEPDSVKKDMEACMTKFMASDKSTEAKCQMNVCMGQKMGLLDSTGGIVKTNITAKIDAIYPASKKADLTKAANDCYTKHEKSLDLTKCSTTYDELMKCALTAIGTICDLKDLATKMMEDRKGPGSTPATSSG